MAKTKVSEYDSSASGNTDINGININEGCPPSTINNSIRELMAQLKNMITGADGDSMVVGSNLTVNGTTTLTGNATAPTQTSTDNSTKVATTAYVQSKVGTLGTMSSQNANAVAITGGTISGITDLTVADGGTGVSTIAANAVVLGNGTSAVQTVAPGTSGNVLTSDGTTWLSTAVAETGIGNGQTWQAVTRAFNTNYTNSTGKPIMLAGKFTRNGVSSAGADLIIDGVQVPLAYNTNSGGGNIVAGSLIIPTGAVYQLKLTSEALNSYSIYELR